MKPLYELCDYGDILHKALDYHHLNDLHMQPIEYDTSIYVHRNPYTGKTNGLYGFFVEDIIRTGNFGLKPSAIITRDRFDMGPE